MESILNAIKKLLGLEADYDAFDVDIMIHINSVFMTLNQLGVGPEKVFQITGPAETWADFCDEAKFAAVKQYVYIKTRILFDPPTSSFVLEALNRQAEELTWRLEVQGEGGE